MQNVVVRKCGKMITHCFLVKKIIFGWENTTILLSLFATLILKVKCVV
jgi:hypothetical protein